MDSCFRACVGVALSTMSWAVSAEPKLLYGEDSRREVSEGGDAIREAAMSVVALIPKDRLEVVGKGYRLKNVQNLTAARWCNSERFSEQATASVCTGFLVGKDRIVTAAHCVQGRSDGLKANQFMAVFSYALAGPRAAPKDWVFPEDAVYPLNQVTAFEDIKQQKVDWAVVSLGANRNGLFPSTPPIAMVSPGQFVDTKLVLIGHPLGLPKKYSTGVLKRGQNENSGYFLAKIDAFRGDSGAPVFVEKGRSLRLLGLVSEGGKDHNVDKENNCYRSAVCPTNSAEEGQLCAGEVIVPVASFKDKLSAQR